MILRSWGWFRTSVLWLEAEVGGVGGLSSSDPLQPQDSNVCWALSLPGTVLRAGCEFSVLSSFFISGLDDDFGISRKKEERQR